MRCVAISGRNELVRLMRGWGWTMTLDDVISDRVYFVVATERDVVRDTDFRAGVDRILRGGRLVFAVLLVDGVIYRFGCNIFEDVDGNTLVIRHGPDGWRRDTLEAVLGMNKNIPARISKGMRSLRRGLISWQAVREHHEGLSLQRQGHPTGRGGVLRPRDHRRVRAGLLEGSMRRHRREASPENRGQRR